MDQLLTTIIVWEHVITLPSNTVYHAKLQESGYSYAKFYKICVCSIKAIENTRLMNYALGGCR